MLNLNDALNNIIAVVVVILLLSLVVQSVQSVVKKFFKIKSRQIEESLVDLLRNVLNKPPAQLGWFGRLIDHSPVSRFLCFWREEKAKKAGVEGIYNHIMDGFKDVGRLAQSGKQMLDSIAKEDLLKILEKVPITGVLPNFGPGVVSAFTHIKNLESDIQTLRTAAQAGAASGQFASISAEYASIEVALRPLFNDVQSIIDSHKVTVPGSAPAAALPAGTPAPVLLLRDMMALRGIKIEEVLKLLGDVQDKLTVASTTVPAGSPAATAVAGLAAGLGNIANDISALRQQLDAAVAPFQAKVNEVEKWYDIVMQSFEERYNRSMKTWAIVIAFLVVALLNADLFTIYRTVAANAVISKTLVEKGPEIVKITKERAAGTSGAQATGQTTDPAAAGVAPPPQPTTSDANKEFKDGLNQLKEDASLYLDVGFTPLTLQKLTTWVGTLDPGRESWWRDRKGDLRVLLGWIVMTMLLSIGAPFWQDTLESLFGIKNLLRKKGDIKNVETASGTGQPNT